MTDTLAAFLNARLDEDEAAAKAAIEDAGADWFASAQEGWDRDERSVMYTGPSTLRPGDTWDYPVCRSLEVGTAEHIARHDPARILRDVEAKRKILTEHTATVRLAGLTGQELGFLGWYREWVLKNLAAAWDDHPDYRTEWKP